MPAASHLESGQASTQKVFVENRLDQTQASGNGDPLTSDL